MLHNTQHLSQIVCIRRTRDNRQLESMGVRRMYGGGMSDHVDDDLWWSDISNPSPLFARSWDSSNDMGQTTFTSR